MSGRYGPLKILYPSVVIGTQEWMIKNLDVTTYRDGTIIPEIQNQAAWAALTTGAWCYYNNDPANGAIYGKLYNWYAINDPRGLAPYGWHISSETEYQTLTVYVNPQGVGLGPLKEIGTTYWNAPNTGATNSTGFTALPNGLRDSNGTFSFINLYSDTWTSTEVNSTTARERYLAYNAINFTSTTSNKKCGLSVRCLKD
jgi:uncharacterized protein (TIGR02145 family)